MYNGTQTLIRIPTRTPTTTPTPTPRLVTKITTTTTTVTGSGQNLEPEKLLRHQPHNHRPRNHQPLRHQLPRDSNKTGAASVTVIVTDHFWATSSDYLETLLVVPLTNLSGTLDSDSESVQTLTLMVAGAEISATNRCRLDCLIKLMNF